MSKFWFYSSESGLPITYITPTSYVGPMPCPYDNVSDPNMFLEFSVIDKDVGGARGLINSFGNMKKALHLRIDMLLQQYGLFHHYGKSNFPTKLAILDDIGIFPTTIMHNLNIERNLLEHEYLVPTEERVKEAIDVTQLIYMASENFLINSVIEVIIGQREKPFHAVLRLEPNFGELRFFALECENFSTWSNGTECIEPNLRNFSTGEINPWMKLDDEPFRVLALDKNNRSEWLPYISLLIGISRDKQSLRNKEGHEGYITTTVSLPISEFESKSLIEFLTQSISERRLTKKDDDLPIKQD